MDTLEAMGLTIVDAHDGEVWIRVHGPRQVQVYRVRRMVAALKPR